MCLIIQVAPRPERKPITDDFLLDMYTKNPDGFGFMWFDGGIKTFKTVAPFRKFKKCFRRLERNFDGEFFVHARIRTHGDINASQSHPYPIAAPDGTTAGWLMHNGVLHTGNKADTKLSDTWHFVNEWLEPLVAKFGHSVLTDPLIGEWLAGFIGNNRFVLMDKDGGTNVLNHSQGIEWNAMWLSNTYAWSPYKFGAMKYPQTKYYGTTVGTPVSTTPASTSAPSRTREYYEALWGDRDDEDFRGFAVDAEPNTPINDMLEVGEVDANEYLNAEAQHEHEFEFVDLGYPLLTAHGMKMISFSGKYFVNMRLVRELAMFGALNEADVDGDKGWIVTKDHAPYLSIDTGSADLLAELLDEIDWTYQQDEDTWRVSLVGEDEEEEEEMSIAARTPDPAQLQLVGASGQVIDFNKGGN